MTSTSDNSDASAGIAGKMYRKEWPSEPSEITIELIAEYAKGLYDAYSFDDWESVARTDVASVFFVTTAFLPLLARGAGDGDSAKASVINISSIWAHSKLNYGVVSFPMQSHLKLYVPRLTCSFFL